jgi:hypothetical protein
MRRWFCSAAVCLAGLATAAVALGASNGSVKLGVRPRAGTARTRFEVRFTAPQQTGTVGSTRRQYTIAVSATSGKRCTTEESIALPATRAGQRVKIGLMPQKPSGVWCDGEYAGRLDETIRPNCGPREICPDYIVMLTVGHFSFRVSG